MFSNWTVCPNRLHVEGGQMFDFMVRGKQSLVNVEFPTARVPMIVIDEQGSYEELAETLGFAPAELVRAQLLEFFARAGIKIYDYDRVSQWLTKKRKEAKKSRWCWRPLRLKDVVRGYRWGSWEEDDFYDSGDSGCRQYERLIPRGVLEKVAKIEVAFGDRVNFFVSDYADQKPDPFIMVRAKTVDTDNPRDYQFVFDHWDEPGFGS